MDEAAAEPSEDAATEPSPARRACGSPPRRPKAARVAAAAWRPPAASQTSSMRLQRCMVRRRARGWAHGPAAAVPRGRCHAPSQDRAGRRSRCGGGAQPRACERLTGDRGPRRIPSDDPR
eukprot:6798599-Prymnesium_polylepis.1